MAARGFPAHEPFTFPSAAMPYYNTEWLFGVVLYGVYTLGGLGAVVVIASTVFFGLLPALLLLKKQLSTDLKSGERGSSCWDKGRRRNHRYKRPARAGR